MNLKQAIEQTKNKKGMKVSITGICSRLAIHRGNVDKGQKYMLSCFAEHFETAKKAWLNNDLETVAEFFGLYD